MRSTFVVIALAASLTTALAQSDEIESEDVITVSPFEVASTTDYASSVSVVGTRIATPLIDPSAASFPPPVAISITRRAEVVAIQFVLSHSGDKPDVRNRELYASVETIQTEVKKIPNMRMEQREVRFAGGNKKMFSGSRGGSPVSFASIVIFADLTSEVRILDRVKQVRDLLQATKLVGATRAADGSVGILVTNMDQYRREILQRIFDDLEFVKKGLGAEFEVRPSGLNQRVRARIASETEIELWIDYSFTIQSVRELETAKRVVAENLRR